MISREQFDAYNRAVANLSDGAQREIESRIMSWLQTDEGRSASVAECREYAKSVMSGVVQVYDSAAASLAAEWYDKRAADSGARLPAAITAATYNPESVDETARYQAKKLANGDLRGFAEYCGELGRNDVLRSLNETIMRNAARDRKKGMRFARVPTGAETCTYCLMLASRGAVYHSRKTAGEFRHFHRRCDCKVVPGFEDDKDAELVEGVRPKELRELWREFKDIDDRDGLANEERQLLKRFVASGGEVPFVAAKGVGAKARNEYVVHMPDGSESRFVTGSEITVKKVFAGNGSEPYKKLRVAGRLVEAYGGEEEERFHVAGVGWIFDPSEDGEIKLADVLWMEHPELGIFEFHCKHWLKRRG